MDEIISSVFQMLFNTLNGLGGKVSSDATLFSEVSPAVNVIATVIKPIGYSLLALFAMIEFARLSERVGNVTGFMGAGLVINVLVKLILCKLVVDNSTEICNFIINLGDYIQSEIEAFDFTSGTLSRTDIRLFLDNLDAVYSPYGRLDIIPKMEIFVVLFVVFIVSWGAILIVRLVYLLRLIELYVYIAISPIPLSTTLSREFNMTPNFLKSFFAVALQGALIFIVVKIFSIMMAGTIKNMGTLSEGDFMGLLIPLGAMLLMALAMVVAAFMTGRWAKSICNAM